MPHRFLTLAIVAFWVAMSASYFYHDILPNWRPTEPTLFTIELVDEAGRQVDSVGWTLLRNDAEGYVANTDWRYDQDTDTFEAACQLWRNVADEPGGQSDQPMLPRFENVALQSTSRIARSGALEQITSVTSFQAALPGAGPALKVETQLEGRPASERIRLHRRLSFPELPGGGPPEGFAKEAVERDAHEVTLSPRGIMLNPLHPIRRIPDLHEGQRWQVPVLDPLGLLGLLGLLGDRAAPGLRAAGLDPDSAAHVLNARVAPPETITYDGRNISCHVVAMSAEDAPVGITVWARVGDGLVLQQETRLWGDTWTFARRPMNFRFKPPSVLPKRIP